MRDGVVDYIRYWKDRTEIAAKQLLRWIGVSEGTFYNWKNRYGKVNEYNEVRLHSALGYVTPLDKLHGREREIFVERDRKLEAAREQRRCRRSETCYNQDAWTEDRALLASNPSADPGPEASAEGGPSSSSASSNLLLA